MPPYEHLSPDLLEKLASRQGPVSELPAHLYLHLIQLCPQCSAAWEQWSSQYGSLAGPIPSLNRRTRAEPSRQAKEQAKRELRGLLRHPPGKRLAVIGKSRAWYRSPLLIEALLDRMRTSLPDEPTRAEHFARLAYAAAGRSGKAARTGLDALAAAHLANTLRAQGKLRDADEHVRHARSLAAASDTVEPLVRAELDYIEGDLRKDQRRLQEAEDLLTQAVFQFRHCRAEKLLQSALLTLGELHAAKLQPERACEAVLQALQLIDPVAEPRLELFARHNLALYLCDAGRMAEAHEVFEENERLYQRFTDRWTQLRRSWLAGRIARGREAWSEAEAHFHQVITGFVKAGIGYDAALASLDLAELYLQAGESQKLRKLAKGLSAILRSEDLHREATAAILLLQKALADEIVSKNLLDHVRGYLEESRNNPALRFEPSP